MMLVMFMLKTCNIAYFELRNRSDLAVNCELFNNNSLFESQFESRSNHEREQCMH